MTDYTRAGDPCPLCKTPLRDDAPIAISCPNNDCPVEDDCDLWYQNGKGEWKRQDWIMTRVGPGHYTMSLTEKEE